MFRACYVRRIKRSSDFLGLGYWRDPHRRPPDCLSIGYLIFGNVPSRSTSDHVRSIFPLRSNFSLKPSFWRLPQSKSSS